MAVYRGELRKSGRGQRPAPLSADPTDKEHTKSHDYLRPPPRRPAGPRAELEDLRLRPEERFLPPKAMIVMNERLNAQDITAPGQKAQCPTLRAGELVFIWYIPRGKDEPENYPAVVIFEHDGMVTYTVAEVVTGEPRARQGRISSERVIPRNEPHELDYVAQGLLMVIKNHRINARVKEAAIYENRAREHVRKDTDRRAEAAAAGAGGHPQTPTKRRRF